MYLSRQLRLTIATMLLMFAVMVVGAFAGDYYVDDNASDNTGAGTSGDPWRTITHALTKVDATDTNGWDTIYVKPGTYSESMGAPAEDFPLEIDNATKYDHLTIVGAGSPILPKKVDATGSSDRVFKCVGVNDVTIAYLEICYGSTPSGEGDGAGIYIWQCQRIGVLDCEIHDNTAEDSGGGIYIGRSSGLIDQNIIWDNTATNTNGGGIYVWEPTNGNESQEKDDDSPLTIRDNCMYGNHAGDSGGAIYLLSNDSETKDGGDGSWLFNNLIFKNTAQDKDPGDLTDSGGVQVGIHDVQGAPDRCAIVTLDNNTIARNSYCGLQGEDECCVWGENNIIWANGLAENPDIIVATGVLSIDYSNVQMEDLDPNNTYTGTGNKNENPKWTELYMSDMRCDGYFLDQANSPCVDKGNGDGDDADKYGNDNGDDNSNIRWTTEAKSPNPDFDNNTVDMGFHYKTNGGAYIELDSFTAEVHADKVVVKWETATEIDNAGFLVYRCHNEASDCHKISDFIAADGDAIGGAAYSFTDTNVAAGDGYYYYLVDIDTSGEWTAHGPVFARIPIIVEPISRLPKLEAVIR